VEEELKFYKERCERLMAFLKQLYPEEYVGPFICGVVGEKDRNGMPEYFKICPTYGVGFSYNYKRVD